MVLLAVAFFALSLPLFLLISVLSPIRASVVDSPAKPSHANYPT
jgi:hypothetical protein